MDKFQNKYRIPSARAQWWDYSNDGYYFITVCTKNMQNHIGEIADEKMNLSAIGEIILNEWNKSFEIRKELFCIIYVLMPNHLHAILRIAHVETHGRASENAQIETHGRASVQSQGRAAEKSPGVAYRTPKSISSFMGGFKSSATTQINIYRNTPKMPFWQPRFHDHIIRNEIEYQRIFNYIGTNIENWKQDKFFKPENE